MAEARTSAQVLALFREKAEAISSQLAKIPNPATQKSVQTVQSSLVDLSSLFNDSMGSLYAYDQRLCQQQLKTLEDELSAKRHTIPKPKFSFSKKSVAKTDPPPATISVPEREPATKNTRTDQPPPETKAPANTDGITITGLSGAYVNLASALSNSKLKEDERPDVSISDLQYCLVDLREIPDAEPQGVHLNALYIRGLRKSVVITCFVPGSIRIQDCQDCIFVIASRQFRVERGERNAFFLHVVSIPVIEKSKELGFAPYTMEDVVKDQPPSQHENVKDFSWIRTDKPSPNWYMMQLGDRTNLQSLRDLLNLIAKSIGVLSLEDQTKVLTDAIDGALNIALKAMKPTEVSSGESRLLSATD